jgi:hypothetical protein
MATTLTGEEFYEAYGTQTPYSYDLPNFEHRSNAGIPLIFLMVGLILAGISILQVRRIYPGV